MNGLVRMTTNSVRQGVEANRNVYEGVMRRQNWAEGGEQKNIPHYCYKEGLLGVSATCRMCRVERDGGMKPVPSCALPVGNGRSVRTETPLVHKAREGVMERRLRNHPLDCPICDQGGECDLQDQSLAFGSETSRMLEEKRGVEDKEIGMGVKMVMTRCIHCTRCVRYGKRVGGVGLGMLGRGKASEIGKYADGSKATTKMGGNRVDRCPVGARTSKPARFKGRPWELKTKTSVDRMDSVGQPMVMEELPKTGGLLSRRTVKPKGSKSRISDKTRYGYDGIEAAEAEKVAVKGSISTGAGVEQRKTTNERRQRSNGCRESVEREWARSIGDSSVKGLATAGNDARWVRGTGLDQGLRETVTEGERRGEVKAASMGVGCRDSRRRHKEESRVPMSSDAGKVRSIGLSREEDRPVLESVRYKKAVDKMTLGKSGKGSVVSMGIGLGARRSLAAGEVRGDYRSGEVRMGAALWSREDGSGWVKRKGKFGKGLSRSNAASRFGPAKATESSVRLVHHKSNSLGSRLK